LRNEKIGYKIREHTLQKVPYLLVVGDREKESRARCSARAFGEDLGSMTARRLRRAAARGECVRSDADGRRRIPSAPEDKEDWRINTDWKLNRKNDEIRVPRVRVIGADGEQVGVLSRDDALRMAAGGGLDLVEIQPNADPPVCRIMDFGKFKFELQKKANAAKKKQKQVEIKELKFRPDHRRRRLPDQAAQHGASSRKATRSRSHPLQGPRDELGDGHAEARSSTD
jgi:hypothetical protein